MGWINKLTQLADKIIELLSKSDIPLEGVQILTLLEKQGVKIPKAEGLYNVNEFIDLENEGKIIHSSLGWELANWTITPERTKRNT